MSNKATLRLESVVAALIPVEDVDCLYRGFLGKLSRVQIVQKSGVRSERGGWGSSIEAFNPGRGGVRGETGQGGKKGNVIR